MHLRHVLIHAGMDWQAVIIVAHAIRVSPCTSQIRCLLIDYNVIAIGDGMFGGAQATWACANDNNSFRDAHSKRNLFFFRAFPISPKESVKLAAENWPIHQLLQIPDIRIARHITALNSRRQVVALI